MKKEKPKLKLKKFVIAKLDKPNKIVGGTQHDTRGSTAVCAAGFTNACP